ncbi:MAG TPA: copper resistance protein CopC [Candidatus Dormibacteraeota bacterium]
MALALAVLGSLLTPLHASAHAYLAVSNPRTGQRLDTAPTGLQLLFTQPVALAHSGVQVFTGRFELVPGAVARVSPTGTSISVTLPSLTNGDYAAIWTVISADDGHLTDGTIAFSVGPAPPPGSAAPAKVLGVGGLPTTGGDEQRRDWPGTLASWLLLIGLAIAGGGLAAERALAGPGGGRPSFRLSTRHLAIAMLVALAGSVLAFAATAGRLHDGSVLGGFQPSTWGAAFAVRVGLENLASMALVLNALGALILLRDRLVCLGSVVGAMVLVGMRAHPASASPWGEAAIVLHVVVALTWVGALGYLATMLWTRRGTARDPEVASVLSRYGRLALLSVLAIVLTGSAAALTQIGSPGQLLSTTYGRLLTLKVALVAWTMLVATLGRWHGLRPGRVDAVAVGTVLRAEVAGVLLVLFTTAALANVAPPPPLAAAPAVAAGGVATVVLLLVGAAMAAAVALVTVPMLRGQARAGI